MGITDASRCDAICCGEASVKADLGRCPSLASRRGDPVSQLVRVTLSQASPFGGVAATTRREVGDASSASSPPCLRTKVKEVKTDAEAKMRMNLKRESWCSKKMGKVSI